MNDFKAPDASAKRNQLSDKELKMAEDLIESMTVEWDPERYRDDYREKLIEWINEKIAQGDYKSSPEGDDEDETSDEPTKVVDLMDYLKRSVEARQSGSKNASSSPNKKRGAATKKAVKKAAKKAAKKAVKKATTRTPAKKAARKKAS